MTKNEYISIGLIGFPFMCVGGIIGGLIVNRYNVKQLDMISQIFMGIDDALENDAALRRANKKQNIRLNTNYGRR